MLTGGQVSSDQSWPLPEKAKLSLSFLKEVKPRSSKDSQPPKRGPARVDRGYWGDRMPVLTSSVLCMDRVLLPQNHSVCP
jgi:hypothetical protein